MLIALTTAVLLSHSALIAAGWGYIASWLAPVLKQDHLSKLANTIIADALIVITALVVALTHIPSGTSLSWGQFTSTLWYAGLAAAGNFLFFLKPTGIDDKIQTLTTVSGVPKGTPPASAPPAA